MIPHNIPSFVAHLYEMHELASRASGRKPQPFEVWFQDRIGVSGFESLTLWAQKDPDNRIRSREDSHH